MSGGWSPYGTLGAALAGGRHAKGDAAPPFPRDVVEAAAAQDLGPELVHLAWEIARLLPDATAMEKRALLLVALAVLAAQRDGSTRVPLAPLTAEGPLPRLLASLGAKAEDQRAANTLLAAASTGEPRLGSLIGAIEGSAKRESNGVMRADAVAELDATASAESLAQHDGEAARGDYRPLLCVDGHLYAHRLWQLERRVIARLRELLAAPAVVDSSAVDAAIADLRARPAHDRAGRPVQLTEEQEGAVRAVLSGRITAVTGGPGTGKTWIVAALLRVVARLGEPALGEVALAAPTGKAADRLQGSLRAALAGVVDPADADRRLLAEPLAASTLHRLLSYSPTGERFLRHERNPLAERLVLVDESSMLDLVIAERLLRSLPAGGRLVLLGDAQQLPSVEAGAVFRDLVQAAEGTCRVARLTRSWRMDPSDPAGSAILAFAKTIATGDDGTAARDARADPAARSAARVPAAGVSTAAAALVVRSSADELAFAGAELLLSPPATLPAFLHRWWQRRLEQLPHWPELVARTWEARDGFIEAAQAADLEMLLAHQESSRLLTPTRGWSGGTGVGALNGWFRAVLMRTLARTSLRGGARDADQPLVGEPVLVTRNDYRRNLYNGDQGIVLAIVAEGSAPAPMAVLRASGAAAGTGSGFRAVPLAALRAHLEPAWASTVHKAQGSEHDSVTLILPTAETRLLTRELLYTAVTRARRSVVVVGTRERLGQASARAVERWSGIAEALTASAPRSTTEPTTAKSAPRQQLALPFPE